MRRDSLARVGNGFDGCHRFSVAPPPLRVLKGAWEVTETAWERARDSGYGYG
jgi:hypothetical protein